MIFIQLKFKKKMWVMVEKTYYYFNLTWKHVA